MGDAERAHSASSGGPGSPTSPAAPDWASGAKRRRSRAAEDPFRSRRVGAPRAQPGSRPSALGFPSAGAQTRPPDAALSPPTLESSDAALSFSAPESPRAFPLAFRSDVPLSEASELEVSGSEAAKAPGSEASAPEAATPARPSSVPSWRPLPASPSPPSSAPSWRPLPASPSSLSSAPPPRALPLSGAAPPLSGAALSRASSARSLQPSRRPPPAARLSSVPAGRPGDVGRTASFLRSSAASSVSSPPWSHRAASWNEILGTTRNLSMRRATRVWVRPAARAGAPGGFSRGVGRAQARAASRGLLRMRRLPARHVPQLKPKRRAGKLERARRDGPRRAPLRARARRGGLAHGEASGGDGGRGGAGRGAARTGLRAPVRIRPAAGEEAVGALVRSSFALSFSFVRGLLIFRRSRFRSVSFLCGSISGGSVSPYHTALRARPAIPRGRRRARKGGTGRGEEGGKAWAWLGCPFPPGDPPGDPRGDPTPASLPSVPSRAPSPRKQTESGHGGRGKGSGRRDEGWTGKGVGGKTESGVFYAPKTKKERNESECGGEGSRRGGERGGRGEARSTPASPLGAVSLLLGVVSARPLSGEGGARWCLHDLHHRRRRGRARLLRTGRGRVPPRRRGRIR